jgi:hypothetical protein
MLTIDERRRLPNFFILGAAKCGTTAIYRTLKDHPDIFLSPTKETFFFANDQKYEKGTRYYANSFFRGAGKYIARGEASPNYFSFPSIVAPRMRDTLDLDALKFVVLIRDPVSRAYSHYLHRWKFLKEEFSFGEALALENDRLALNPIEWCGYYHDGLYGSLAEQWLEYFPRDKFLFISHEDLLNSRRAILKKICLHLGVDTEFEWGDQIVANPFAVARSRRLMRLMAKPRPWLRWVDRFVSREWVSQIRRRMRQLNSKRTRKPPLDKNVERELRELYAEDIERLEKLLDRDFSRWKPAAADAS